MKFEIDVTNRAELLKKRGELLRTLAVVEFALRQLNDPLKANGNGELSQIMDQVDAFMPKQIRETDKPVKDVIDELPSKFSTSDVMVKLGTMAKESRGLVRTALARFEKSGYIHMIEKGRGRKPSRYTKTSRQD